MADFVDGEALIFEQEALNGTVGPFTATGANTAILAAISCANFGDAPSITSANDGASIPRIGSDVAWIGSAGSLGTFERAPGPASPASMLADWASNPFVSGAAAVVYSGVDQTTPTAGHDDDFGAEGGVSSETGSIVITGCTIGQKVGAWFSFLSDGGALNGFTPFDADHTIVVEDYTGGFLGLAFVEKTAQSTTETISLTGTGSGDSTLYWVVRGFRINNAAGGGGVPIAVLARNANQLIGAENAT